MSSEIRAAQHALRRAALVVALLNLSYFGVEFAVALAIASVSLFADSVDFLEDATVNLLILLALGWSAARRRIVGMCLAGILLVPGLAALWTAWEKLLLPVAPSPVPLTLAGLGALVVNVTCAAILARVRLSGGSLSRAAYLSARNDVLANVAIVLAGFATAATASARAGSARRARYRRDQRGRRARGLRGRPARGGCLMRRQPASANCAARPSNRAHLCNSMARHGNRLSADHRRVDRSRACGR